MAILDRAIQTAQSAVQSVASIFKRRSAEPLDPKTEPIDDAGLISMVDMEFKRRQRDRIGEELVWRENIAFANGDQFYQINTVTQNLEEVPIQYDWEEREVFDQISPVLETRHARLTRGNPIRKVRPASNRQADVSAAEVSGKVIRFTEQETNHEEQLQELVSYIEQMGTVWKKNPWNHRKGPTIGQMDDGQAGQQPVREGDLDPSVVPCTEMYGDNLRANWRDQRSVIHAKAFHVDEIYDTWGVRVAAESVDAVQMKPSGVGARGLEYGAGGFSLRIQKLPNHALVKEYWERVSERYPEGRLIIVCGGKLLYAGVLPFMNGKDGTPDLPFVPYYCIQRPGMLYGTCLLPRLKPLQRRYNSLRNRRAEYLKRAAIGQLIIWENTVENIDEIELNATAPGQIFIMKPNADPARVPRYMENQPLPAEFAQEEQTLLYEIQALSGVSDFSKMSQAPAGVKSGIALQIALEQDETRLSTVAGNIHRGMIEDARQWLRLYKQFVRSPRVARISSQTEVEMVDWTASDIRSDDVIIEPGTGLGESLAQRKQFVLDLLASGILNNPETGKLDRDGRAKILDMIEFGHWESAADSDYDLQREKQVREIQFIKMGGQPQPAPIDDDIIHIQTLQRWMLSGEYEEAAGQNPALANAAYQHLNAHMMSLQTKAMQQAAQGAAVNQVANPQPIPGEMGPAANPQRGMVA